MRKGSLAHSRRTPALRHWAHQIAFEDLCAGLDDRLCALALQPGHSTGVKAMRIKTVLLSALLGSMMASMAPAMAQVQLSISSPNVSVGFNLGHYPRLVQVPGYPVYYAPGENANYFFYDGLYWMYEGDRWLSSSWYNGPWRMVEADYVPLYILRVPVSYYRRPPTFFNGWQRNAAPRWNEHYGNAWEQRHDGWNRYDRRAAPAPAPIPSYQRNYNGNRYPAAAQQQQLHEQNYRYQSAEPQRRGEQENRGAPT
jgi:hypothetical protein